MFFKKRKKIYYECKRCNGIFIPPAFRLNSKDEKKRYEEHNNDVEDAGYQNFVAPITSAVFNDFSHNDIGLDFGAGTGPVIAKILRDNNYDIKLYDPFFHKNTELLNLKYNYIVCCEVMEHFYNPHNEFALLKKLLKTNGKLYCFTHLYTPAIKFDTWYYSNDATHVFIYQENTIRWIKEEFGFSSVLINGKLIIFSK